MPFHSEADRRSLLDLARRAISAAVSFQKPLEDIPGGGVFAEPCGVFVTLHTHERLRGCIGVVETLEPLGEAVARCAASAALGDPRFSPVQPDEVRELQIEISLLSSLEPIHPENIEIGTHGLLVSHGPRRGLLLPQVALEHKFSREQFLAETCRKAGLHMNAWQEPGAQIFGFRCEVFSETNLEHTQPPPQI